MSIEQALVASVWWSGISVVVLAIERACKPAAVHGDLEPLQLQVILSFHGPGKRGVGVLLQILYRSRTVYYNKDE